jgi:hypothetical protein
MNVIKTCFVCNSPMQPYNICPKGCIPKVWFVGTVKESIVLVVAQIDNDRFVIQTPTGERIELYKADAQRMRQALKGVDPLKVTTEEPKTCSLYQRMGSGDPSCYVCGGTEQQHDAKPEATAGGANPLDKCAHCKHCLADHEPKCAAMTFGGECSCRNFVPVIKDVVRARPCERCAEKDAVLRRIRAEAEDIERRRVDWGAMRIINDVDRALANNATEEG